LTVTLEEPFPRVALVTHNHFLDMHGADSQENSVRPTSPRRAPAWIILFLLYTLIAVLLTGYRYLDDLTRQHPGTFYMRVLEEGTGVYSVFLLLPLIFRFARI